jgi:hypothetical protein
MATPVLARTPFFFIGERPVREARIAAYIRRQHRAARRVTDIFDDPYLRRCANETLCWRVLTKPETIAMLRRDLADAFAALRPAPPSAGADAAAGEPRVEPLGGAPIDDVLLR